MNSFSFGLIVRLFLLCAIIGLCVWVLTFEQFWATKILAIIVFASIIAEIVRYAESPQLRIASFIESLPISSDLPLFVLPAKDDAEIIFRRFVTVVQKIKTDKQVEYELFVAAANHLAVAMLVFDRNGIVKLCNKAALQLLRMSDINNISQIAQISGELSETLLRIQAGEQLLVKTNLSGRPVKLSVRASHVRYTNETWNILTIQDIQQEIAQEETEAWQNILRILTHEIINSTSPINLLSGSLEKIADKEILIEEDRQNMKTGLQTIGKRSRGMTAFVESYRATTNIAEPAYAPTNIGKLLHRVALLFKEEAEKKGAKIIVTNSTNVIIQTDENLLEQALINLLRNAIEAADKPQAIIELKSCYDLNELLIEMSDNGCGIASENIGSVFTPFFSTKSSGTGVGLFISRKIVHSLRGTLAVQSVKGQRTIFSLRLPLNFP